MLRMVILLTLPVRPLHAADCRGHGVDDEGEPQVVEADDSAERVHPQTLSTQVKTTVREPLRSTM